MTTTAIPYPIVDGAAGAPALVRRHSCAQLRQVYSAAQIEAARTMLNDAYDSVIALPEAERPTYFVSHAIVEPEQLGASGEAIMDFIDKFVRASPVIRVVEKILDGPVRAHRGSIRLRRHKPDQRVSFVPWHQDQIFMGNVERYINCWTPLTDCGADAPGLDLIPVRPTKAFGTSLTHDGGYGMGGIDPAELDAHFGSNAIWTPEMRAGDCLLFDSTCVHRTSLISAGAHTRMSLEIRFGV